MCTVKKDKIKGECNKTLKSKHLKQLQKKKKKKKKIEKIHSKNYKWKMTNGKLAVTDIHSHAYSLCLLKTDSLLLNLDSSKKLKLLKMLILFSEIRRSK